jgi:hypothetical protein
MSLSYRQKVLYHNELAMSTSKPQKFNMWITLIAVNNSFKSYPHIKNVIRSTNLSVSEKLNSRHHEVIHSSRGFVHSFGDNLLANSYRMTPVYQYTGFPPHPRQG